MPRPNPRRAIASEQNVARRFTYERERRGWSYESLAQRMTDAGCPIQGSALYKIEKGRPRRRITVDELAAFAQVLGEHAQNLLRPVELVGDREADELVTEWLEVQTTIAAHVDRAATLTERLETLAANGTLLAFPVHEVLASGLFREVQEAQERAAASFELFR